MIEDCYIVETLDWRNPPPVTLPQWLITVAVSMDSGGKPRRFPQGQQADGFMADCLHPLLADPRQYQVVIPRWRCVEWDAAVPCDPYKLYKPV